MKQFLYLDTDIVNSIIAQSEKGIITGFSTEEENGEQKSTNKSISGNLEGDAGGKLLKVFNAELMQKLPSCATRSSSSPAAWRTATRSTPPPARSSSMRRGWMTDVIMESMRRRCTCRTE